MSEDKTRNYLEYLEGVMMAQSLVLMAIARHQPGSVANLEMDLDQILSQLEHLPLAQEKKQALAHTLDQIIRGRSSTAPADGLQQDEL